jgi:D-tyrosyl-tRNA(Tyr) deacylase
MRAVIQRVRKASVSVENKGEVGKIEKGLVVLLGVAPEDSAKDAQYLADKIIQLRIFEDDAGKMNRSLGDIGGSILAVSQFTLLADCRKGRRPSFAKAAPPELASSLYEEFVRLSREKGIDVQTGIFAAKMEVSLVNDGPVTLILESA